MSELGAKLRRELDLNNEYLIVFDGLESEEFLSGFLRKGELDKGYALATGTRELFDEIKFYYFNNLDKTKSVGSLTETLQISDKEA